MWRVEGEFASLRRATVENEKARHVFWRLVICASSIRFNWKAMFEARAGDDEVDVPPVGGPREVLSALQFSHTPALRTSAAEEATSALVNLLRSRSSASSSAAWRRRG